MRNYEEGTPVIRRLADGIEESLVVEHITTGQVTFRTMDGRRQSRTVNTSIPLRLALCGYKVVPPAPKMRFDNYA